MLISHIRSTNLYKQLSFNDGNSVINISVANNRKITGFLLLKLISDNDSFYAIYPFTIMDDGAVIVGDAIQTNSFFDLSATVSSNNIDEITININGSNSGGTLYLEFIGI